MTSPAVRTVGNYELGALIGRGGMSDVYAGVHRFLGHPVAVKLLRGADPVDQRTLDAFLAEAAQTRAVQHPNVVAVLDFGRDESSGCGYLVMERVDGENLAARLRRETRLDEAEARALAAAIADGMQAAHDLGIVHRDLKPANVMLRGDQPKLVDFGLARHLEGRSALETGRRLGTPAYMAPEQLTGGLIAPCVDIWALGVILFEMLTGRLPFEGFTDGRCPQLFEAPPRAAALAAISPALGALVSRCLERNPGARPASMAEVARDLRDDTAAERITQDAGPPAPPTSTPSPARRPRVRPWRVVAGAAGAIASVAVALILGAASESRDSPARPSEDARTSEVAANTGSGAPGPASPAAAKIDTGSGAAAAEAPRIQIEVRSDPAGAEVLVGGARRGVTPTDLTLAAPSAIVLRKAGYLPARVRVEQAGLIDVRLAPRPRRKPDRARPRETLD